MKKQASAVIVLILSLVLSLSLVGFAQDDFSAEPLIEELRRAEKLINSGEVAKGVETLKGLRAMLDNKISQYGELGGQSLSDLKKQIDTLRGRISELEGGGTGTGSTLKVGYVNAKEAFNVFMNVVKEERQKAQAKTEELVELREKAIQGKISKSEFKKQSDILQAEKLKAQLAIDMAMVRKMMEAKGFESVADRLKKLKGQVDPIMAELEKTLKNMRQGTAIPEEVQQKLSQINSQYQQLDDLLTRLIESKIFQMANIRAKQLGYDLVLRQENVVLYSDSNAVDDLTSITKDVLRKEMSS